MDGVLGVHMSLSEKMYYYVTDVSGRSVKIVQYFPVINYILIPGNELKV